MRFGPRGRGVIAVVMVSLIATLSFSLGGTAHAESPKDPVGVGRSLIGSPYSYGGVTPGGFDCSGFTMYVFSKLGLSLPHSSGMQYALGDSKGFERIANVSELRPGDLVFHGSGPGAIQHVGIYVGNHRFVSSTSSSGVQVRSLHDSYWGPIYVGGVRTPLGPEPDDRPAEHPKLVL
jgi:cell wall-associated NlpC family hydrolase